jgi:glucosamine--fructose-6-phosphate aminotransferase (isomerizing)
MCGIFGYVKSSAQTSATVIDGLKELEYRGYDSWGLAIASDGGVMTEKKAGKIGDAQTTLPFASSALGHTRWATHGGVTDENAHPHTDCSGHLALIHNGIVENYVDLRGSLHGHRFQSDTDSEVVAHLLEEELANGHSNGGLCGALMTSFSRLSGLSAIAVLDGRTGEIVAAKNGSPLVVGVADDGSYLASDPVALLPHTRKLIFVEDGQAVRLTATGPELFDTETRARIEPDIRTVSWASHGRDLGHFDHFMIKEISEQPQILRRLASESHDDVERLAALIGGASEVIITGCGTAHNAAMAAQYVLARIAHKPVRAVMASELMSIAPALRPGTLLIALSQSGETIDVLDACRLAHDAGASIAALTNSEGSTLHRISDLPVLLHCGPERCVLATKTYTAKLAILLMAAYVLAGAPEDGRRLVAEGASLIESKLMEETDSQPLDRLAATIATSRSIFILGRHLAFPLALEAALKIKEVSYIHAEGFASGELKHGVIALIEEGTPCLILAPEASSLRATLAGASEVAARGGRTIGFSHEPHPEFAEQVLIHGSDESVIFETAVCFQILAYRLAVRLERDPDRPRNLAKSVTVR